MAVQATGVYSIPLYDILTAQGIQVVLVNAQHTKNVPGRKRVQECQWLMKCFSKEPFEQGTRSRASASLGPNGIRGSLAGLGTISRLVSADSVWDRATGTSGSRSAVKLTGNALWTDAAR